LPKTVGAEREALFEVDPLCWEESAIGTSRFIDETPTGESMRGMAREVEVERAGRAGVALKWPARGHVRLCSMDIPWSARSRSTFADGRMQATIMPFPSRTRIVVTRFCANSKATLQRPCVGASMSKS